MNKEINKINSIDVSGTEKIRGLVTAIISGTTSGGLNQLLLTFGTPYLVSTLLSLYLFGNLLAYSLDILFAKYTFNLPNGYKGVANFNGHVPYNDYITRLKWLFSSFLQSQFFRFLITVLIDTLIGLTILNAIIQKLDEKNIHFPFRNLLLSGGVAVFTFIIYLNALRFDWAYVDKVDPITNIVVLMWTSIVLIVYSSYHIQKEQIKKDIVTDEQKQNK